MAKLDVLEVTVSMMGRESTIYPVLISNEQDVVLVDTGYPGQLDTVRQAVEGVGADFGSIDTVIITHQDIDHIGGLGELVDELPGAKVLSHEVEKPYIEGDKTIIKLRQERIEQMPDQARAAFERLAANPPGGPVHDVLDDGEELDLAGGITVLHTPGHTPGHICLYHPATKTLVAGDLLFLSEDGQLQRPQRNIDHDQEQARAQVAKLTGYDIERVVCYHGGVYEGDANERIAAIAEA